jgi:hypothetical protein
VKLISTFALLSTLVSTQVLATSLCTIKLNTSDDSTQVYNLTYKEMMSKKATNFEYTMAELNYIVKDGDCQVRTDTCTIISTDDKTAVYNSRGDRLTKKASNRHYTMDRFEDLEEMKVCSRAKERNLCTIKFNRAKFLGDDTTRVYNLSTSSYMSQKASNFNYTLDRLEDMVEGSHCKVYKNDCRIKFIKNKYYTVVNSKNEEMSTRAQNRDYAKDRLEEYQEAGVCKK